MNIRNVNLEIGLKVSLLLLAVFLLYSQSLHTPLFFDDPEEIKDFAGRGQSYFNFDRRWLADATFGWTVRWLGYDLAWLRLGNISLHAANVVALFLLLRHLFGITRSNAPSLDEMSASPHWLAFFGALLFALHPVAVYGVGYLIQRSTLMATLFVLLMLLSYLRGLLRGGWHWMVIAVLCYFLALYSKEHSIAAPAVALALTFLVRKPSLGLVRQISPYYFLCALSAASMLYITHKMGLIANAYEPNAAVVFEGVTKMENLSVADAPNLFLLSLLTQSGLFFKYLLLWVIPNPAWMSIDMREPFAVSYWGWRTLSLLCFIGYFCVAVWLLLKQGRRGLLGLAMLFPWLLFLTEVSTVRAQEPFVLYRSYLWMPGLMIALPLLFAGLAPKRAYLLLGILAILLIPLSLNRLHSFSSGLLLWNDAEKLVRDKHDMPGVERIYAIRANEFVLLERYSEAVEDFTTAIKVYPRYDFLYCDRATAKYMLGKYQAALMDYNRALSLNVDNPICYTGRAQAQLALGNFAAARLDFEKSCALGLCKSGQ